MTDVILCGRLFKNNAFFLNNSPDKLLNFKSQIEYAFNFAIFYWMIKQRRPKKKKKKKSQPLQIF